MTEPIESTLRTVLSETAAALPGPDDAWHRFATREQAHQRSRRRTRRLCGAVVAGVVVTAVAVQANVLPLPGWAPGIAIASANSAIARGPVRGSLASDATWLASFRRDVKGIDDPEGYWRVADRGAIRVVFAADVADQRLALVLVPLRFGLITNSELVWYQGPAGAAPDQMTMQSNDSSDEPVASFMQASSDAQGVAVVVAPPGTVVSISDGVTYAATGVVRHHQVTTDDHTGVGIAALPPSPITPSVTTRVTDGARVVYAGPVYGGWSGTEADSGNQEPTAGMLVEIAKGARGPALDPAILKSFVINALNDSRLSLRDVTIHLRWTGTVNRQRAALITVQPRDGGVLAYAFHGSATESREDLRLLLPAAGADERPIAWRMRAEGRDDETDHVIVVAQTGTSATVTANGRAPAPVPTGPGWLRYDDGAARSRRGRHGVRGRRLTHRHDARARAGKRLLGPARGHAADANRAVSRHPS